MGCDYNIELLFKELKRHYRLEDMPSGNRDIVESLLYTAILSLAASRRLLQAVRAALSAQAQRLKEHRFATLLAFLADELLTLMLHRGRLAQHLQQRLSHLLFVEAFDPNKSRLGLLQAIEDHAHLAALGLNRSRMTCATDVTEGSSIAEIPQVNGSDRSGPHRDWPTWTQT